MRKGTRFSTLKRSADDLITNEEGDAIFYAKRSSDVVENEEGEAIFYAKRSVQDTILNEEGEAIFYAKSQDELEDSFAKRSIVDQEGGSIFYAKRSDDVIEDLDGSAIFYLQERDLPVFSEEEIAAEKEKAKELFQKVGELLGFN